MRLVVLLLIAFATPLAAQTVRQAVEARTEDGRVFIIKPDGTWSLIEVSLDLNEAPPPAPPAPPPPAPPSASAEPAMRTAASASGSYTVRYDANTWRSTEPLNSDSEFTFTLPFGAGLATTIFEVLPLTSVQLKNLVLENARSAGGIPPDVLSTRQVDVDGEAGIRLEYEVRIDGVDFLFITTVVGTDMGSLQVLTWTSPLLIERYRDAMIQFHDGISLTPSGE